MKAIKKKRKRERKHALDQEKKNDNGKKRKKERKHALDQKSDQENLLQIKKPPLSPASV